MKVLHIQTSLGNSGNAAYRLHTAMLKNGVDSMMLMLDSVRVNSKIAKYSGFKKFVKQNINRYIFQYYSKKLKKNEYLFTYPCYLGTDIAKNPLVISSDVIYLHWIVGGFLTLGNIRALAKLGKPIVFFMHDMWTFTGGCHHSFDCKGYENGCFNCPMFKKQKRRTIASIEFKAKKKLFDQFENFYFASPSKWLDTCSSNAKILSNHIHTYIPNIVDETIFKPISKEIAKQILNIPTGPTILTFGSVAGTNNPFKGWEYLKEALNLINPNNNILILIYGNEYDFEIEKSINFPVLFLGKINDETTMAIVNSASDIYVSPSLAESFGLSFLENIFCNTPVVGFNVWGIP